MTKQKIIDTFIAESGRRGDNSLSTRELATLCDIKSASLYHYFKSRELIVQEAYRFGLAEYATELKNVIQNTAGQDFQVCLQSLIRCVCRLYDEDPMKFSFLVSNQQSQYQYADVIADNNIVVLIRNLISLWMDKGLITIGNADIATLSIIGMISQMAIGVRFKRLPGSMLDYAEDIFDLAIVILKS